MVVAGGLIDDNFIASKFFHHSMFVHGRNLVKRIAECNDYHALRRSAMPTAFTAHDILNGSFSVVNFGTSSEE